MPVLVIIHYEKHLRYKSHKNPNIYKEELKKKSLDKTVVNIMNKSRLAVGWPIKHFLVCILTSLPS